MYVVWWMAAWMQVVVVMWCWVFRGVARWLVEMCVMEVVMVMVGM